MNLAQRYRQNQVRRWLIVGALVPGLVLLMLVSVSLGASPLGLDQVLGALVGGGVDETTRTIVWELRLPRVIMGLLVGLALGSTGAVMQILLRNPLADPYMLGLSAAAGFGASLAMVLGVGVVAGPWLVVGNAFLFSLGSTLVILTVAQRLSLGPTLLLMLGLALLFFFQALTTMIQYFGQAEAVKAALFWSMGDLGRADAENLALVAPLVVASLVFLVFQGRNLHLMNAGDEAAQSLGVNVASTRRLVLVVASLLTAGVVSFVGTIGFIGLVAPHVVRLLWGNDARVLVPASGLVGGVLLLLADLLARMVLSPVLLPVGALTAFLGVPLFVFLLLRSRGGAS